MLSTVLSAAGVGELKHVEQQGEAIHPIEKKESNYYVLYSIYFIL